MFHQRTMYTTRWTTQSNLVHPMSKCRYMVTSGALLPMTLGVTCHHIFTIYCAWYGLDTYHVSSTNNVYNTVNYTVQVGTSIVKMQVYGDFWCHITHDAKGNTLPYFYHELCLIWSIHILSFIKKQCIQHGELHSPTWYMHCQNAGLWWFQAPCYTWR